jgi:ATP-dependent DNA helicase RecQ
MRVLIVAKTRMSKGACIGGLAWNGQAVRSVRLIEAALDANEGAGREYQIGDVWEIVAEDASDLLPPHVENIIVHRKQKLYTHEAPASIIEKWMPPHIGNPQVLYDGYLQTSPYGALYIDKDYGIPAYSTTFWRADQELQRDTSSKRIRYRYDNGQTTNTLTYVGFQEPPASIPAGTLLRVSLAHWWQPSDSPNEPYRCFVQLSGWFEENGRCLNLTQSECKCTNPAQEVSQDPELEQAKPVKQLLFEVFGYREFRSLQQELIENILARRDTLVIMPTGSGKSLCYQLPAICFSGLTVVISPLIALMQDQVMQLQKLGVAAVFLNSSLRHREYVAIMHRIKRHEIKLLYIAPETLLRHETLLMLDDCQVDCLAIDEAHCVSHWGHDFRPDYRQIATIRTRFPRAVCVALTATATPRVQEDIAQTLGFSDHNSFIASFDRPNLYIALQPKLDLLRQTLEFLAKHSNQSGIIYCGTQRQVNSLCASLHQRGISALPYHAGMSDALRKKNQQAFTQNEVPIIVATVAFGMGIDKPDVRFVLHVDLPKNLESYYQEIGRAGRDGSRSDCLLLFSYGDVSTIQHLIQQGEPSEIEAYQSRLETLIEWIDTGECRRHKLLAYFGENYAPQNCGMCDNCNKTQAKLVDLTGPARKLLDCVWQTRESFGVEHIIKVLRGSKAKEILKHQHEQLSIYDTGKSHTPEQWKALALQLVQQNFLQRDLQYGGLSLSELGLSLLRNGHTFSGTPLPTATTTPLPANKLPVSRIAESFEGSRSSDIGQLFFKGANIASLMNTYNLKRQTIINHLDICALQGMKLSLTALRKESNLTAHAQTQLIDLFTKLGCDSLKPIFLAMAESVHYEEIHLMRVIYRLQND